MKKILVTASTFPRYMQDTEPRFIYDLCKEYTKYYDVTVLVPAAPGALDYEEMEGMHVVRYHYFPIHKWETLCYPGAIVPRIKEKKIRGLLVPFLFLALYRNLKKWNRKVDAIHANWLIPQGIIQGIFGAPYILTGLGGDVTSLNESFIRKLKKNAVDKAKSITVVSEDLKKSLEKNYQAQNVQVIPMGCSLEKFSPANKIENFFSQKDKKVILFVGRLVEKKGASYIIEAMRKVEAKLIIVGDGPERQQLEQLAKETKADIEFVGPKNKQELAKMYASCDVFCIPSVVAKDGDKEGLPVALIEAMASGAPVVGTHVGGIGEILVDGENGYIVREKDSEELVDKLNQILKNDDLRNQMKKNARTKAEKYDFIKIGLRYKAILDDIIEEKNV